MDLTQYGASPYGEKSPARGDQNQHFLAAALRGLLGQEETGSVLDPATAGNKSINDKMNLASILSDILPTKGAATMAAGAGHLIPVVRGFNKDATAMGDLLRRVTKAGDLKRQGATTEEILQHPQARLMENVGIIPGMNAPEQARWLHEIVPDYSRPRFAEKFRDPNTKFLKPSAKPKALGDVLDPNGADAELMQQYPQLKHMAVQTLKPNSDVDQFMQAQNVSAVYHPMMNSMAFRPSGHDLNATFEHEMTHGIQNNAMQYQNLGYGGEVPKSYEAQMLVDALQQYPEYQGLKDLAQEAYSIRPSRFGAGNANEGWQRSSGEYLAELAADRADRYRSGLKPWSVEHPDNLIPDTVTDSLRDATDPSRLPPGIDTSQRLEYLINTLRNRGALP